MLHNDHVLVAEVGDEIGPFVDTGVGAAVNEQWEAFDFAPDDEHVVFVHKYKCAAGSSSSRSASSAVVLAVFTAETAGANCYVLTTLDLGTGELKDLDETLVNDQTNTPRPGPLELPAWSPDGSKIAYTLDGGRELWVVNADGTNTSRVALAADVSVQEPRWSPDGKRISFTSRTPGDLLRASTVFVADVASGRLERVSTGPNSADRQLCCAEWVDDSHLRVGGALIDRNTFWLVALNDMQHETPVSVDLTDSLVALGAGFVTDGTAPGDPGRRFFWQPVRNEQP
jgi:hypothetical protein